MHDRMAGVWAFSCVASGISAGVAVSIVTNNATLGYFTGAAILFGLIGLTSRRT